MALIEKADNIYASKQGPFDQGKQALLNQLLQKMKGATEPQVQVNN